MVNSAAGKSARIRNGGAKLRKILEIRKFRAKKFCDPDRLSVLPPKL